MRDKTIRTVGATIVLLGLAIAAILQLGGGGDPSAISIVPDDSTESSAAAVPVVDTEPAPGTVAEPFTYRVAVLSGVTASNFWEFYGREASVWNSYILGPTKPALYTLDADGEIQTELAETVVTPRFDTEGWRVRVELDESLAWSDGTPITAHDFVFTFETVRALKLGGSWADAFPTTIESIHADSDIQLRIEFTERPSLAVWPHGPGLAPIMPSHVWADQIADADRRTLYAMTEAEDLGGGPLAISEVDDNLVVSEANPGYGIASSPDRVEYHVFADEAEAAEAVLNGDVDTFLSPKGLTAEQIAAFSSNSDVVLETSPANGVRYLGFNLDRAPMSDKAFRRALALLVDRDELAEDIGPLGASTYAFISDANQIWFDADAASSNASRYQGTLSDRLTEAIEELGEAGYTWTAQPTVGPDGSIVAGVGLNIEGQVPAPLTILTTGDAHDPWRPEYAAEIAETLGWLGFDARPVETDFDTVVDLAFTPGDDELLHYDMYLLGWTLGNPSLPSYYRTLFSTDGEMNNTGYSSKTFDMQLADYEASYDLDEARTALWKMEKTLSQDLPYLLLYSTAITEVYRADQVAFDFDLGLGGLQGQLGGITGVKPASN